ncbi:MAG TPA: hypothetical protein VG122_00440 [Gemmata sp.]|nr:hypothetical protein [Gemmata sp.]
MGPPDSNVADPTARDSESFLRLIRMIAGENRHRSTARGLVVLLPLVRRAIQTGHGPLGLVRWIQQALACRPPCASLEERSRELTEELVRFLIGPPDPLAETCAEFE